MKNEIEIIGSGGAFDTETTNSSFLVNFKGKKLLVDCGYNVFEYLRKNEIDIDCVFVTHTHFDHIGSLESLIYYNYFVKGKTTTIYSGFKVYERLVNIFRDINQIYENGQKIFTLIANFKVLPEYPSEDDISCIETNHIVTPSYAFVFKSNEKTIIISGDTKASKNIVKVINNECKQIKEVVVFHDYSMWDDPLRNIHCCETDFKIYYEPLLKKYENLKFIFYHNGTNIGHKERF